MLETILKIIDLILSIEIYCEELHLGAKDYQNHLLMERIGGGFDEHKDAIRETAIQILEDNEAGKEQVFSATRNLKGALDVLNLIPAKENIYNNKVEYLKQIYEELLSVLETAEAPTPLRKEFDDLSARASKDIYLINQTLKGGQNGK